ncbi:MAG TPA: FAD-dependent monooxygenase, partial [Acidimicrobiales bacterium]
ADPWQVGRVFLAGDAAHLMPPFAGQGMCSGIRDAANLAWKLDLVLDGRADPALLATFEEERRPGASAALDLSSELGKVICVPDPTEAAARDEVMAAAVTGEVSEVPGLPGIGSGLVHPDSPLAGERRWFDDAHGAGWRLVTRDLTAEVKPEVVEWFATLGGVVVHVDDADVPWALQRPDFHLYGTAADAEGAGDLLAHLRQQLTSGAAA